MLICRLILAFWLILSYDLWEDRCVSDVTLMNNFWWKICCDRLKNRTGRFGCCCKLSSVKKCKKITASLILLKRGLEFKTKLKKGVVRKVEKKHGKNSQILHILIYQGRGRRLLRFSYMDHPTKSDVTSGLNCAAQLASQSEKMAFRFAKIFFHLQTIRFVSFQTEGRKMLQAHFFDFESKTFGKRQ